MKVLFITNIPSPYRVNFFNELGKTCELTVVFEGKKATDRNDKWKYEEVKNFNAIFLKGVRTKSDAFICIGIINVLKEKWDHIIIGVYSTPTGMIAIEYLKRRKIPFLIEADGGMIGDDTWLKYKIKHYFISSAYAWFSSGKITTEYLVHYGAKKERVYWYPFTSITEQDIAEAVLLKDKNKTDIKKKLGINEKCVILSVGRFTYDNGYGKGFDVLVDIAQNLRDDIGIYIVGDDPTPEFVEIKEKRNINNVHYIGFQEKKELAEYYLAADVFILLTRGDVWGLVINEAMLYSLPIITTTKCVAGTELVMDEYNGYLVDVDNKGEIVDLLNKLISSQELMKKYGNNSFSSIKKYTIESMSRSHYEVLVDLKYK